MPASKRRSTVRTPPWSTSPTAKANLYELFAQALAVGEGPSVHLLVRSRHNRQLAGQDRRLWDAVTGQRARGRLQVRVGRRGEQPARLATLTMRFRQVTLAPPARKADQPPLTL